MFPALSINAMFNTSQILSDPLTAMLIIHNAARRLIIQATGGFVEPLFGMITAAEHHGRLV